jgi:hypothetical protein
VDKILGFNVPKLIRVDDELLVVEMSIVLAAIRSGFCGLFWTVHHVFRRDLE